MANGKFTLGKQSGGTLGLVFPDGVSDTEVVLPESGELATKDYVKNNGDTNAVTSFSQISGTNEIVCIEFTNNIHDVFGDGSAVATYLLDGNANDLGGTYPTISASLDYKIGKFGQSANISDFYGNSNLNIPFNISQQCAISLWFDTTLAPSKSVTLFDKTTGAYCGLKESGQHIVLGSWSSPVSSFIKSAGFNNLIFSFNGNNTCTIYHNSNNIGTFNNTGTFNKISSFGTGDSGIAMNYDQIRIFNRALTAQEVQTLYSETRVSENATLNINQGLFIYPKGLTPRGYAKSSDTFTGTVQTSGVSDGWKYIAKDEDNNFSFYNTKPTLGKTSAELYLKDGKLYKSSDDTGITPISFLSNKVRFASGVPMELAPSDISKTVTESLEAKEVLGKNQCTGFIHSDATFTPPSILDYYNISTIVRNSLGNYTVTFIKNMQNANYSVIGNYNDGLLQGSIIIVNQTTSSFTFETRRANDGGQINPKRLRILIFGGKN